MSQFKAGVLNNYSGIVVYYFIMHLLKMTVSLSRSSTLLEFNAALKLTCQTANLNNILFDNALMYMFWYLVFLHFFFNPNFVLYSKISNENNNMFIKYILRSRSSLRNWECCNIEFKHFLLHYDFSIHRFIKVKWIIFKSHFNESFAFVV